MKTKTTPTRTSKKQKDETTNWPFIRWIESRGRWMVDTRTATGGKRTFYKNKEEAIGSAQAAKVRRTNEGNSGFDDRELTRYGWTIQKAIAYALAHLRTQEGSVTIPAATEALVAQKRAAGKSDQYQKDLTNRLRRVAEHFDGKKLAAITTADLDAFLGGLTVAPGTKNTFRRDVRTLWSFAEKRGWGLAATAKHTEAATTSQEAPGILRPEQAARLLSETTDPETLAFHAIGLFAGLRVAEIKKLQWTDIDFGEGWITVSAQNSKTRSRRLVPILPSLKAWLEPVAKVAGPVLTKTTRNAHEAAREAAGIIPWPSNAMRHSFVSYRLAATTNAPQTALESGHDQGVLFAHYRELVRPKDAERFFSIRPIRAGKITSISEAA